MVLANSCSSVRSLVDVSRSGADRKLACINVIKMAQVIGGRRGCPISRLGWASRGSAKLGRSSLSWEFDSSERFGAHEWDVEWRTWRLDDLRPSYFD